MTRVIMVGPDPAAHGGIASVVQTLLAQLSLTSQRIEYVSTWVEVGAAKRMFVAVRAFWQVFLHGGRNTIVHLHVASRGSFARKAVVFALARARGSRTIVHLHGGQFHSFAEQAWLPTRALIRWVFGTADVVIVLSAVWRDRVAVFSGRVDCVELPNPVAIPRGRSVELESVTPRAIFLGRLCQRKGVDDLIAAIDRIQRDGMAEVQWLFAGDGDLEHYRRMVSRIPNPEQVRLTGWLGREDVVKELASSSIFCLPSYDEGKPVALLEAMAYGLACVATPVGGVPDLIIDGETGHLVTPGDSQELASVLEKLIRSPEARRDLGVAARRLVEAEYAAGTVAKRLSALYQELA